MSYEVVHADEVEAVHGRFRPFSDRLGVSQFRINRLELGPGDEAPEHDHSQNGQEEVYAVVGGSGTLRVDGKEVPVRAGHFVYCAPGTTRQLVAGDEGLVWIGIGGPTA
jgi:quercetin dioxygenase-like cupin family protein